MCEIQPVLNMKTLEPRRVHRLCVFIVACGENVLYKNYPKKSALFWVHFDPKNSPLKKKVHLKSV